MQSCAVLVQFADQCVAALDSASARETIYRLLSDLIADPPALAEQIPRFADDEVPVIPLGVRLGGESVVHRDERLTVMVLDTLPGVVQPPHEHRMDVCIGVFEGTEEQRFWTRTPDGIRSTTGRMLEAGEVMALGSQAIHAISAPADRPARAVHVYLGDIYSVDRSVFHPETLAEHPMTEDLYNSYCLAI